jgi:hypothetical protein
VLNSSKSSPLTKVKISRQELLYPHGQDNRTLLLNSILRKLIVNNDNISFKCEIPGVKYNLTILVPDRNDTTLIWSSIHHIIEEVLIWYDISHIDNFEIKIGFDRGTYYKCTYYDLYVWMVTAFKYPPDENKMNRILNGWKWKSTNVI